jgi:hypothetical protein
MNSEKGNGKYYNLNQLPYNHWLNDLELYCNIKQILYA